jgi:hypothetical protein
MRPGKDSERLGPPRAVSRNVKQLLLVAMALSLPAAAADSCDPHQFQGTYGFQLSGQTTISGAAKASASMGNVTFQWEFGAGGSVSGYSSSSFAGYLLGNPVTGTYEAHENCTLTWSMQDDSGNYQHFSGTMTPDFKRIHFRQTEAGTPEGGLMMQTPRGCGAASLLPRYRFTLAGSFTPMEDGQRPHRIDVSGTAEMADGGKLTLTVARKSGSGTFDIDSQCIVQMELNLPEADSDHTTAVKIRGIVVDDGKQILGIQMDPGATATATFHQ